MKRIPLLITLLFALCLNLQAQDDGDAKKEAFKSKRGVYILPEGGDIALGFNAVPFFNYLGNMLNGAAGNTLAPNFIRRQAIVGKYFLNENNAVRAELRIGYRNTKNQEFVIQDGTGAGDNVFVTDKMFTGTTNIHFAAGYEMRRGHGRVQGYFGGMGEVQYQSTKNTYEYGNAMTVKNPNPTSFNFGNNLAGKGRRTEAVNLQDLSFGVRGFIGVEYFFAPKISLGAEFGWGPRFQITRDGKTVDKYWDGQEIKTETLDIARDTNFNLDTDNAQAGIFLIFHF